MIGYIRLFLALAVLVSHVDVRIYGLNPGVTAVVVFYMLAGVVVTHLWHSIIPAGPDKLWRFYKDRLMRIAPLYLYATVLTLCFLLSTDYGSPQYAPLALLNNLLIIPLNYYMYIDSSVMSVPAWNLIPQAWSLGAELQAYLLLPLALVCPRLRLLLFGLSLTVYIAANLTYINADYYGYRLLPGVFFVFLIGSYLRESQSGSGKLITPVLLFAGLALVYLIFAWRGLFPAAYMKETLIGMLVGIPVISFAYLSKQQWHWNRFMGSLSYGVFLTHFLVIWALDYWEWAVRGSAMYWAFLLGMTVTLSAIGVLLIENPLVKRRRSV